MNKPKHQNDRPVNFVYSYGAFIMASFPDGAGQTATYEGCVYNSSNPTIDVTGQDSELMLCPPVGDKCHTVNVKTGANVKDVPRPKATKK